MQSGVNCVPIHTVAYAQTMRRKGFVRTGALTTQKDEDHHRRCCSQPAWSSLAAANLTSFRAGAPRRAAEMLRYYNGDLAHLGWPAWMLWAIRRYGLAGDAMVR